jgi:hypothetical protein
MAALKKTSGTAFLLGMLILHPACNKAPTNAALEVGQPTIIVLCRPDAEAAGTLITAAVFIMGNTSELRVFGLDVSFDGKMLQFQEVRSGTLTGSWAAVDGNEVGPGSLKVGGFLGAGTPVAAASQGTLAEISFRVTGSEYGNGQQSQVCARQYTDDLWDFQPDSACALFTLKK